MSAVATAASTSGSGPRPAGSSIGIHARPPERRVGRIHDQPSQAILCVGGRRVGANQVLAPLRDLGFRLHQIERRDLPGVDTDLVLACELLRELERALLNGDIRHRGFQRPVRPA